MKHKIILTLMIFSLLIIYGCGTNKMQDDKTSITDTLTENPIIEEVSDGISDIFEIEQELNNEELDDIDSALKGLDDW